MTEIQPGMDERRQSFGAWADDYDRYRPEYPPAFVSWLANQGQKIVDIGAGTGQLSRLLLAAGADVLAVEPDERMRSVLARHLSAERVQAGSAEQLPVDNASVDIVVGAQMWHWVDHAQATAEAARVLHDGGQLVIVWNLRDDREPWVAAHSDLIDLRDTFLAFNDDVVPSAGGEFTPYTVHNFTYEHPVDEESFLGFLRTHSLIKMRGDVSDTMDQTRTFLHTRDDLDPHHFSVPYVCKVFTAQRRVRADNEKRGDRTRDESHPHVS